jgi:hypothetical protein
MRFDHLDGEETGLSSTGLPSNISTETVNGQIATTTVLAVPMNAQLATAAD